MYKRQGEKGVETVVNVIDRAKVDKNQDTGVVLVTKENIDTPEAQNVLY